MSTRENIRLIARAPFIYSRKSNKVTLAMYSYLPTHINIKTCYIVQHTGL